MRMENILLGVGPILMIEVERDLTFDDCAMQSLSGRKTEAILQTLTFKTCKLLNLFRYHCNEPCKRSFQVMRVHVGLQEPLLSRQKNARTYVDVRGVAGCDFATWRGDSLFSYFHHLAPLLLPLFYDRIVAAPRANREALSTSSGEATVPEAAKPVRS